MITRAPFTITSPCKLGKRALKQRSINRGDIKAREGKPTVQWQDRDMLNSELHSMKEATPNCRFDVHVNIHYRRMLHN